MRRRLVRVGSETRTCHTCARDTQQEIVESVRRDTVLGIPVGARSRRRYAVCPRCGSRQFLPDHEGR